MANLLATGSRHVIPAQMPAMVGLRYLLELVDRRRIPRPRVIYLDTAHECTPHVICSLDPWTCLLPVRSFYIAQKMWSKNRLCTADPETVLELRLAFQLLAPGGILTGTMAQQ